MITAVALDIDNTLTDNVSWLRITELLGASAARHESIFQRYSDRQLPYSEAKRQLVEMWQATGKAYRQYWQEMFDTWPLDPSALPLADFTRERNLPTALITGSVDLFAEAIAKRLNIPHWYANTRLIWDEKGALVDFAYVRDQSGLKLRHLQQFTSTAGTSLETCAVVGDGDNDAAIFQATGHGIAVGNASREIRTIAWKQARDLKDVIDILAAATSDHGTSAITPQ